MTAESLMLVGGAAAFLLTVLCVRRRSLSEKYAVIWLAVATLLLVAGVFPVIIMTFAETFHLAYPSAVLFISLATIYLFSMSVSISLTRQKRSTVRLMQDVALLRYELEQAQHALTTLQRNSATQDAARPDHAG